MNGVKECNNQTLPVQPWIWDYWKDKMIYISVFSQLDSIVILDMSKLKSKWLKDMSQKELRKILKIFWFCGRQP